MKAITALCCCIAFCSSASANLFGSDDFNDNVMDASKWSVFMGTSLSETNSRLEYTSPDQPETVGVWMWELNDASYVQDWTIYLDAFNAIDESSLSDQSISFGILAFFNDPGVYFDVNLQVGDDAAGGNPYRVISTEVESPVSGGIDYAIPITADSARLQISFDAATKEFTGYYDIGGGQIVTTNFNTADWGMTDTNLFTIVIYGLSTDLEVASGEVYGDNFVAVPEPGTLILLGIALTGLLMARRRDRLSR
jgi:hypothetical protein